jgi:hypothetical protein
MQHDAEKKFVFLCEYLCGLLFNKKILPYKDNVCGKYP